MLRFYRVWVQGAGPDEHLGFGVYARNPDRASALVEASTARVAIVTIEADPMPGELLDQWDGRFYGPRGSES